MATTGLRLPSFDRRVWILFAGMALNQFGMSIVMPYISIYLFVYEGTPATLVGFAMFFSTFVWALFQLIGEFLLDYFPGSPWVAWVVVGFTALLFTAGFAYLNKLVPPEKNTAMIIEM